MVYANFFFSLLYYLDMERVMNTDSIIIITIIYLNKMYLHPKKKTEKGKGKFMDGRI